MQTENGTTVRSNEWAQARRELLRWICRNETRRRPILSLEDTVIVPIASGRFGHFGRFGRFGYFGHFDCLGRFGRFNRICRICPNWTLLIPGSFTLKRRIRACMRFDLLIGKPTLEQASCYYPATGCKHRLPSLRGNFSMRRVVVTGLGAVCPSGNSVGEAWEAVLAARPATGPISLFDPSSLPVTIAAEVRGFDPTRVMPAKEARQSSRFVQFAVAAAKEAVENSGFDSQGEGDRYGCCIGVGVGGAFGDTVERGAVQLRDKGPRAVSPLLVPYAIPNMASGLVSIKHGLKGVNFCTATACAKWESRDRRRVSPCGIGNR